MMPCLNCGLVAKGLNMKKISPYSIEIERTFQGAWRISAMIDGYLVSKQYMGYTKKEAVALFQQEHPEK